MHVQYKTLLTCHMHVQYKTCVTQQKRPDTMCTLPGMKLCDPGVRDSESINPLSGASWNRGVGIDRAVFPST